MTCAKKLFHMKIQRFTWISIRWLTNYKKKRNIVLELYILLFESLKKIFFSMQNLTSLTIVLNFSFHTLIFLGHFLATLVDVFAFVWEPLSRWDWIGAVMATLIKDSTILSTSLCDLFPPTLTDSTMWEPSLHLPYIVLF